MQTRVYSLTDYTEDETQAWARKCAAYILVFVAIFMGLVSLSMPFMNAGVKNLWFSWPNILMLSPMPVLSAAMLVLLWRDLRTPREYRPFFLSLGLFLMNYIGLGISMWPRIISSRFDGHSPPCDKALSQRWRQHFDNLSTRV
jgi:cytochrome d ubiquinol oxidase subunit II